MSNNFFSCKVCKEKDLRIHDLQQQISRLERLVFPSRPSQDITLEETELNRLLDPSATSDLTSDEAIRREADAFLTGEHEYHEI